MKILPSLKPNLKTKLKSTFLLAFLLVEFFGSGFVPTQLTKAAGCSYSVSLNETNGSGGVTNATNSTILNFVATVNESGLAGSCTNKVSGVIENQNNGQDIPFDSSSNYGAAISNGTGSLSFTESVSQHTNIFTNNTAKIKVVIYDANGTASGNALQTSDYWTVNLSGGSSTTSGSGTETITLTPTKPTYNAGDVVAISVSIDSGLYSSAQSQNLSNLYIKPLLTNQAGAMQAGFGDTYSDLINFAGNKPVSYGSLTISTDNDFVNGANTLTLELWSSTNGNLKLSSATVPIQVTGLGSASSPTFSLTPPSSGSSYKLGDNLNVTFTNMPAGGWNLQFAINGGIPISCSSSSCPPIALTTQNGANDNAANTFKIIKAFDNQTPSNPIIFTPDNQTINIGTASGGSPTPTPSGSVGGIAGNSNTTLYNPLPENDLTHVFLVIVQGFLGIIGIWAVMFIIVGGFQMVMASGNEEMYLKAKKTITWAILGLAIALLSFSIIAIVQDLLQAGIKPATTGQLQEIKRFV